MKMDTVTGTVFFVSVRTETNQNSICFGLFAKLYKFLVCFGVSEPFRNEPKQNIGVSKQTETEP
jgi:hypothetical protein